MTVLEADDDGNVFVSFLDPTGCYVLRKIDPDGAVLWTKRIDEFPACGYYLRLLTWAQGRLYAVGVLGSDSFFVVRFTGDGVPEWTYTREVAPGYFDAYSAAVDADGSLLLAGALQIDEYGDYLVAKVSAAGVGLWERTVGGDLSDVPAQVVVGTDGRVTVSGISTRDTGSEETGTVLDYLTVQWDANGNELWNARLERTSWGSIGFFPVSPAIALDSQGDVLLTGAIGEDDEMEFLLVKYGSTGNDTFRKQLPQHAEGKHLVVDASDRIYVAAPIRLGSIESPALTSVFAFSSAGEVLWQETTEAELSTWPASLSLHSGGLVIAATQYDNTANSENADAFWRGLDFAGNVIWEQGEPLSGTADVYCGTIFALYDKPNRAGSCLAGGPEGATYLGGSSSFDAVYGTSDHRVLKLDAAGHPEWTRGFSVPGDDINDQGSSALAVGADGAVHLGGEFWTYAEVGGGVTTNVDRDVAIAFDGDGNETWFESLVGGQEVVAVNTDASGSVYVLESLQSGYPSYLVDIRLVKLGPAGGAAWSSTYTGPGGATDAASAQIITPDGRIVYVGQASVGARLDGLAVAHDANGNVLFTRTVDSSGADARLVALASVPGGMDIVAAGHARNQTGLDALVVRLDADGNVDWRRDLDGDAIEPGDDEATAIALDQAGNTYIAGRTWNGDDFDVFVVKLDPSGNEVWRRAIDFGHGDDAAWAAAFDAGAGGAAGSLWIAGRASNGNDTDALTLRLDADGNELFHALVAGTEQRNDEHYDLMVGPPGHATVAGVSAEIDESYNFQAIRYVTVAARRRLRRRGERAVDGMLILRWLFGFRGSVLAGGCGRPCAVRAVSGGDDRRAPVRDREAARRRR